MLGWQADEKQAAVKQQADDDHGDFRFLPAGRELQFVVAFAVVKVDAFLYG